MANNFLVATTMVNFINLVLNVLEIARTPYESSWRYPGYNFYLKRYMIYSDKVKHKVWIIWENMNGESKAIIFRRPKYKSKLLNKIYFMLCPRFTTDDGKRSHALLKNVIFPDFCKELGIDIDLDNIQTATEAADIVMNTVYKKYFTAVPVEKFISLFGLANYMSKDSLDNMKKLNVTPII